MKKEDIKRYLKTYSVYSKRRTTINHAFASAIAPSDDYSEEKMKQALSFLGQLPDSDLLCVFCDSEAETWDHLLGLVKNGELRGFGHQIGNLVPCCKECNSKKGSKEFDRFIRESNRITKNKDELILLLKSYQNEFAIEIDLARLREKSSKEYDEFLKKKKEIFRLMSEADDLASTLRKSILD
ncbi:HNH endonuclease [Shewanella spartinae]|uniref:HNH endonuclease n=1 Tax=Shewanella spartinae TaxID=2864205 RepID=UPI001C6575C2|nr:HNH endonuclease [Shewanella spartinae]QYJ92759.1 HNH endonuclease [Shewanella spartinae]